MATATSGYNLLDDFLPEILQYCNGAPSILVRIHLLNAAIEFCNKSQILKKEPSNIQLGEDVHTYTLKYPQNRYRAIAVDEIKLEGATEGLIRTTEKEMDSEFANWRSTTASKPSRYFLTDAINKIRVWPMPSADIDTDYTIQTIVTYKRDQTELDDYIYEKWSEVLQAGALAKLLVITGATWANPQLAAGFHQEYRRGIREARKTSLTGTGKYPGRVIPQSFDVMGSNANRRSGSWE